MIYVAIVSAIGLFIAGLWLFRVVPVAYRIVAVSREAARIIGSSDLDDTYKEREIQRSSVALLRDFLSILIRSVAAIGLSLLPLWALDISGHVTLGESMAALASWQSIVIATIAMTAAFILKRRS